MSTALPALERFVGARCLITGGSRGLGLAIGRALAREGAKVAFTYRKSERDAEAARELLRKDSPSGHEPLVYRGNVSDGAHANATLQALTAAWGGLDVLVNNAGSMQVAPIALLEESDWNATIETHARGAYLYSRAALKPMIRARKGRILSIGTFASERVVDAPVHYATAKAALRGFTESLAREVGRYGITVNLLCPGILDVGIGKTLLPHRIKEYTSQCPLGRVGTAAEVAECALFLLSEDSSFVTGAKVVVDGGL